MFHLQRYKDTVLNKVFPAHPANLCNDLSCYIIQKIIVIKPRSEIGNRFKILKS